MSTVRQVTALRRQLATAVLPCSFFPLQHSWVLPLELTPHYQPHSSPQPVAGEAQVVAKASDSAMVQGRPEPGRSEPSAGERQVIPSWKKSWAAVSQLLNIDLLWSWVMGWWSAICQLLNISPLLFINFLWSSMNEFLERTLWLRFRERRVSALNPKQSCRLGWKHENLLVPASFWLTTANPLLNQNLCVCSAAGLASLSKQTGINPSRIAENKVSAQNTNFFCVVTQATKRNKLQTQFGPLLLSCQMWFGIVCLHVWTLPISDQIWVRHALSALGAADFQNTEQQQQRTNHNKHVWNTLRSKSFTFCDGLAKKTQQFGNCLYELSAPVVTTASFRKDVAKKVARDWVVFQG